VGAAEEPAEHSQWLAVERGAARARVQEEAAGLEASKEGSSVQRGHRAAARQPSTIDRLAALALFLET